ncbi:uncharacterized protein I206_100484 [Kwoniella pini CBS 10737]|uniref:NADH:ubiquinone oxidoreductase intermediate-associated protein 30 domain-containing protein n=1 Tax=Kwoniella pini CBS 10737 TaxID=1296096 RepID=A0A1B9ID10_9TREE|nr:uncharacterized protein I206_00843 [Kwoniella pini CBS 10737]OCF53538.1 hypothetical protein I206_00843 [Kwoniella pini CBS 10737]
MPLASNETETIFPSWQFDHWRAVDDRVRGGSSISHLDSIKLDQEYKVENQLYDDAEKGGKAAARFWGNLDIDTLGGAGFASQAYRYGPSPLKLPQLSYNGIAIHYQPDPKTKYTSSTPTNFTFVLKTTPTSNIPKHPKTPGPPREAQLTYEVSFPLFPNLNESNPGRKHVAIFEWKEFKATYRGKNVPEGDEKWVPLDPGLIYELSIMCRSDFGKQHGDFGVVINSIEAVRKAKRVGMWIRLCDFWKGVTTWVSGLFSSSENNIRLDDEDEKQRLIV